MVEIRGDTGKHKGKSNQNFHSKTSSLFSLTIVFYRVEKEREVGPTSRFGREEQLQRLCILVVDRESFFDACVND